MSQCNLGVWECGILCSLIRCYLVNGFGEMLPKSSPFGEQWFTPSMVLIGEIGCPRRLKNLMVQANGDIFIRGISKGPYAGGNGDLLCDVTFLRPFQEWELETLHSLFAFIYSCKIGGGGIDRIGWLPSKNKIFEVVLL